MALDELHVQKRRFLGVEIAVQDQVVIVNAEEFLVVKIHSCLHVLVSWEEFGLGQISIQTKFFSRACMRLNRESARKNCAVWVSAPPEMVKLNMANGGIVKRLCFTVPASKGNRYVEAIRVIELVIVS